VSRWLIEAPTAREFEAGGPEPSWPEELKSSPLAHIPNKGDELDNL